MKSNSYKNEQNNLNKLCVHLLRHHLIRLILWG